jgi:uroporphyrinogen-III synthase
MRILVLRPLADAERSARAIAARGNEPLVAPLFDVVRLPEPAPEGSFDALVLASGNAVPVLADAPADWRSLPVFTVGARTAAKAREAGYDDARSADGDRNDLIELISRNVPSPAQLLLILGRDRREDLPQRLSHAGYAVTIWTAYAAKALPGLPEAASEPLRAGSVDAVLHYSVRGAQTYIALAREAGLESEALAPTHVALSADVATPLITAGADTVLVAEFPEEAAMLAALDQVSARHRLHDNARDAAGAAREPGTEQGAMSETETQRSRPAKAQGSARRTPPTIEGVAQEAAVEPVAPAAEPAVEAVLPTEALPQEFTAADAAPEPATRPSEDPPVESPVSAKPQLPWRPLAVAGLVGGVVGAGLVMLALSRATPAVDPAEIAQLRSRIDALQGAATALDRKAAAASDAATKAGAEAQATAARLGELASAQRGPAPDAEALAGLSAQAQRAEAVASALGQRLEQTTARIGSVETLARTAAAPSAQALAAARIVLAERVQGAIASGKPFSADVAALAKGGAAADQLAALNAVAASGAPTQAALLAGFREHRVMFQRELTPTDASWQDRLLGLASRIVTIRPVGDIGANDPATLLIRLENAIASGNIVAAAGLWGQLPEPARRASADFGANLQKRAAADAAIAKIAQDAVAALGAAG